MKNLTDVGKIKDSSIKLEDIKKLDVEKDDIVVIKKSAMSIEQVNQLQYILDCKVIALDNLEDIGILKFKKK